MRAVGLAGEGTVTIAQGIGFFVVWIETSVPDRDAPTCQGELGWHHGLFTRPLADGFFIAKIASVMLIEGVAAR